MQYIKEEIKSNRNGADKMIKYQDIVLLNGILEESGTRFHVGYKNEETACVIPPGECCLTEEARENAEKCIQEYYESKGEEVRFSEDGYYFFCSEI